MTGQTPLQIESPALPKMGGSVQSIGKGWGAIGTGGEAGLSVALPISQGRGFAPTLELGYSNQAGNSMFGMGWTVNVNAITLRTTQGVPHYDGTDQVVGPDGDVWMPERADDGSLIASTISTYNGVYTGAPHQVVRHWPRVEGEHALIEHWSCAEDPSGFWLVHSADGGLHLYGKNAESRRFAPLAPEHVGAWLICESLNPFGEHIVYEYKHEQEPPAPPDMRDYRAQRYLKRVHYGNATAYEHLYGWIEDSWKQQHWHFHLVFDYGEHSTDPQAAPTFDEQRAWPARADPIWSQAYGFEIGTRRLCRNILMFHAFAGELGPVPMLVQQLMLEHRQSPWGYSLLAATHALAYDSLGQAERRPPTEYDYTPFTLSPSAPGWSRFDAMPGLDDGYSYQLVDLYGEGLPGVLSCQDKAWYYREPLRDATGGDQLRYGEWARLEHIPVANTGKAVHQSLADLTGDARLDWIVSAPGMHGYFTLDPDREWSHFVPFNAFPKEFFHPAAQMADLIGNGLSDMVLIGSRSVRLYANRRDAGFAPGLDVPHPQDQYEGDELPLAGTSPTQLVAFADVLGSGSVQLVRIRHDEVKCWPNLGHGRFGKGFVLCTLPFNSTQFNAEQIRLTDLDGSGAADLICLTPDAVKVFMNHAGSGYLSTPVELPWPDGVRYDRFCQVSTVDLQGIGCASLVLTVPHMTPRHWRYDFVDSKPYLLSTTCNNMGARTHVTYRSSAQEWLDEKQEKQSDALSAPVAHLPLTLNLVKHIALIDEISGTRLTQSYAYRAGHYDSVEREFRGFGLLLQTDTEATPSQRVQAGFSAPLLSKTWFHTGIEIDPPCDGSSVHDPQAVPLNPTLVCTGHPDDKATRLPWAPDEQMAREIARSLSGRVLRSELFNADDPRAPYAVIEHRACVGILRPKGPHQPYAVVQPDNLETISYQYEPHIPDDPLCQHLLNLAWDEYGNVTHAVTVYYARRKTANDEPPFSDEHQQQWWRDAHDDAQQKWYLTQEKAQYIHHLGEAQANLQAWRLNLPYLARSNALVLEKSTLSAADINHENLRVRTLDNSEWARQAVLTSMSRQFYMDTLSNQPLAEGKASFQALVAHRESAELDANALGAYDRLLEERANPPFNLKQLLESPQVGYHIMQPCLPTVPNRPFQHSDNAKDYLWCIHQGFPEYEGPSGFHALRSYRQTRSHGVTTLTRDRYNCLITAVQLPDGCTTRILDIDYRTLLPGTLEDANRNLQQARYTGFGEPFVTTVHGTEKGVPSGFHPLDSDTLTGDRDPRVALENKQSALGKFASAGFWDLFSWMGCIDRAVLPLPAWMNWATQEGFILPSGHFYDRARRHLGTLKNPDANEQLLKELIDAAPREPVYRVTLIADQFADQAAPVQIRASITCLDGFGRTLQTKQEVEPGMAWCVGDDGALLLNPDGSPKEALAARRWRISQPVEYNNKGLAVREYRPYFADKWRYINDRSMRQHALHDQQFYDGLGRPTHTVLARTMLQGDPAQEQPLRRETWYWLWNTVAFDENDLFVPPAAARRHQVP